MVSHLNVERVKNYASSTAMTSLAISLHKSFEKTIHLVQQAEQKHAFQQRQTVMETDGWLSDALSFDGN